MNDLQGGPAGAVILDTDSGSSVRLATEGTKSAATSQIWVGVEGSAAEPLVAYDMVTANGKTVLRRSPAGSAAPPLTDNRPIATADCTHRVSAVLVITCESEQAVGADFNGDGDQEDHRLLTVRPSGITTTSTVLNWLDPHVLSDGSLSIGGVRIDTSGQIQSAPIPNGEILATVGTNGELVKDRSTGKVRIYTPNAAPIDVDDDFYGVISIGSTPWLQYNDGTCRLSANGQTDCFDQHVSEALSLDGEDAIMVAADWELSEQTPRLYFVPASGSPQDFGEIRQEQFIPIAAGGFLVSSAATWNGTRTLKQFDANGLVADHGAVDVTDWVHVSGDQTLVNLASTPGATPITHVVESTQLTTLGLSARLHDPSGRVIADALEPSGTLLLAVDEIGTDLNGDGDTNDNVAHLVDSTGAKSLELALSSKGAGTTNASVATAANDVAYLSVSEQAQNGKDLNGDGDSNDQVIFDLRTTASIDSDYQSIEPTRVLDTRPQFLTGYTGPKPVAGQTIRIDVPANARAAAIQVTAASTEAQGWVTAYPCDAPVPNASNVNTTTSAARSNLTITEASADGGVCLWTSSATHLIGDIVGIFSGAADYVSTNPTRLLDTRFDIGYSGPKPVGGQIIQVTVPANAKAAVLNVTAVDPTGQSWVTAFPCGTPAPNASNLNPTPGQVTTNLTITQVGANGKICLFTAYSTHLIADLNGWFPNTANYQPQAPVRLVDTRDPATFPAVNVPVTAGQIAEIPMPDTATRVTINVTALNGNNGWMTVFPCGTPMPATSNLNLAPGQISAGLALVDVGLDGSVCIFSSTNADLIVDLTGQWVS